MRLSVASLLMLLAPAVHAQERITPQQFIDLAHKRTMTFVHHPSNVLVGVEEFIARNRSVWARDDGRCTYGEINLDGLYICFLYDDDPGDNHCWIPYLYDGDLIVRSTDGEVQRVSQISDDPVICEDAPLS